MKIKTILAAVLVAAGAMSEARVAGSMSEVRLSERQVSECNTATLGVLSAATGVVEAIGIVGAEIPAEVQAGLTGIREGIAEVTLAVLAGEPIQAGVEKALSGLLAIQDVIIE